MGTRLFCRIKRRWTFVHKGEVRYDVTEVQEGSGTRGAGSSRPNYEVELEWCGPRALPDDVAAAKLAFKAADVMRILAQHATTAQPSVFVAALGEGRLPSVVLSDAGKAAMAWSELRKPAPDGSSAKAEAGAQSGAAAVLAGHAHASASSAASGGAAERAQKRGRVEDDSLDTSSVAAGDASSAIARPDGAAAAPGTQAVKASSAETDEGAAKRSRQDGEA